MKFSKHYKLIYFILFFNHRWWENKKKSRKFEKTQGPPKAALERRLHLIRKHTYNTNLQGHVSSRHTFQPYKNLKQHFHPSSQLCKLETSFRQSGKLIVNEAVRTDRNLSVATAVQLLENYTEFTVYTLYIVHIVLTGYTVSTVHIMYTVLSVNFL